MDTPTKIRTEHLPLLVGAMVTGFMLLGCGMLPLFDPLEAHHAEAARELLEGLPSLVPSLNGVPSPSTPPLSIWIQALLFSLLGESELVARLPSALATGATAALLVRISARLLQPTTAAFSGLAFGLCLQTQFCGRAATADAPALLFTTAALHLAIQIFDSTNTRRTLPLLLLAMSASYLCIGLRAVASAAPIVILALQSGTLSIRRELGLATASSVIPLMLWSVHASARSGTPLSELILAVSPFRFAGIGTMDYLQALPFHCAVLLAGVLPFAHFLPDGFRAVRARATDTIITRYVAMSALVPLALFTLAPLKHPAQVLPSVPSLLLIAGLGAESQGMSNARWFTLIKFSAVTLVLVLFLAPIGIRRFSATYNLVPHLRDTVHSGSDVAICGNYQEPSLIWEIRKATHSHPVSLLPPELKAWLQGPGVRIAVCTKEAAEEAGFQDPKRVAQGISLRDGTRVPLCVLTVADLPR